MLLPTFYVVSEYYLGLNAAIANFSLQNGVGIPNDMPIGVEYLAFSVLFFVIVLLFFGIKSLKGFALPGLFAGLVGFVYTIDSIFPYGAFTPFQILVPTTATLAAKTLNLMGYATVLTTENGMPTLQATGALGTAKFSIAWPCAGIESFLIFAAVALLFLQQMQVSWKAKTGFFVFGVIVTYFINVLRITTIFTLGMQYGVNSTQVTDFHSYYGPLYSITWIVLYPIVILISLNFWQKRKMRKSASDENLRKPQPTQLSLA